VRLEIVGEEHFDTLMRNGGRAIFAFWHGKMIIPLFRHINDGVYVLVSRHRDGEIIARILESLGCGLVRGSSTRGGAAALKEMIRLLRKPGIVAITPDGPKGPRRRLKAGPVILAQSSGVPILPMSAYTSRPSFLKSWDRFLVVKPFVRCVLMYGEPIRIDRDLSPEEIEEKRAAVEQALYRLDEAAETYFTASVHEGETAGR